MPRPGFTGPGFSLAPAEVRRPGGGPALPGTIRDLLNTALDTRMRCMDIECTPDLKALSAASRALTPTLPPEP